MIPSIITALSFAIAGGINSEVMARTPWLNGSDRAAITFCYMAAIIVSLAAWLIWSTS